MAAGHHRRQPGSRRCRPRDRRYRHPGDGSRQITLAGWPVYRYIGDPKPGAWKGQNVGGTWFVVAPTGKKNLTCLPTPAPAAVTPPAASQAAGPPESTSTGNGYGY
ncbi:hypothetical protein GCM10027610_064260 [Dactylosporangium cerinum]